MITFADAQKAYDQAIRLWVDMDANTDEAERNEVNTQMAIARQNLEEAESRAFKDAGAATFQLPFRL